MIFVAVGVLQSAVAFGAEPAGSPAVRAASKGASAEERLKVAKTVKVKTDILGVELGAPLQDAHAKLDPLSDPAQPAKMLKGRGASVKVVWQLEKTPFASVYVKTNEKREIENLTGFVRPGEEVSFDAIGNTKKAPLQSDTTIVWDVIRPDRPHIRLVAEGRDRKASVIKVFVVPRIVR